MYISDWEMPTSNHCNFFGCMKKKSGYHNDFYTLLPIYHEGPSPHPPFSLEYLLLHTPDHGFARWQIGERKKQQKSAMPPTLALSGDASSCYENYSALFHRPFPNGNSERKVFRLGKNKINGGGLDNFMGAL